MSEAQDFTKLLERLEAFEERCGVTIEALFAQTNEIMPWIEVKGEMRPRTGSTLERDLTLVIDVYDRNGRLIGQNSLSDDFRASNFFGFATFDTNVEVPTFEISRIRIYPKFRW